MNGLTIDREKNMWRGGVEPFSVSYGKMAMWFFIVSDAITFSGFLAAYGFVRFKFIDTWPIADEVFVHFPFLHGDYPMYYVALMTFILIFSSVTMVLAVDAGHQLQRKKVAFYMALTVIGGIIFVLSQVWEWKNFIKGDYGAIKLKNGQLIQFVNLEGKQMSIREFSKKDNKLQTHTRENGLWFEKGPSQIEYTLETVIENFRTNPNVMIRIEKIDLKTKEKMIVSDKTEALKILEKSKKIIMGANLIENEYGSVQFANFFFFITGFHGFHVISGIVLNIIILINVLLGTYEKRRHYEMVEKVGLYWHFIDLVWIFVFTFFYLI